MNMQSMNGINTWSLDKEKNEFFVKNLPLVERTDGTIEPFNPNRIRDSIIKETGISEEFANKITLDVIKKLISLDYELVTAPFIRETVCALLPLILRYKYTRLGIPYFDFKMDYKQFFDQFKDCADLTDENIMTKIIAEMKPKKLINLIKRIAKDYIGVRNKIQGTDVEERKKADEVASKVGKKLINK